MSKKWIAIPIVVFLALAFGIFLMGHGVEREEDVDGDGLFHSQEMRIGTDPNNPDTDGDGVLDGAEREWNSDTDRDGLINARDPDSDDDGFRDGIDVLPLFDAGIGVIITYFREKRAGDILGNPGDYYFVIEFGGFEFKSGDIKSTSEPYNPYRGKSGVIKSDTSELYNPYRGYANLPDNIRYFTILVEAWDRDWPDKDEQADINESIEHKTFYYTYDITAGKVSITSDGGVDGVDELDGYIKIEIITAHW